LRRILTVASQKGGVGKTTTALNLAYSLGRLGASVLLFDLDPQSGLALATNLRRRTELGLVDFLKRQAGADEIRVSTRDGVFSMIGLGQLTAADMQPFERAAWDGTLGRAIEALSRGFQVVLVDAPAGVGGVVRALLAASDGVLLVVNPRTLAVKSLPPFLALVEDVAQASNPRLQIEGVLVSMINEGSLAEAQVLEQLGGVLPEGFAFRTQIPADDMFEQASLRSLPLALLPGGETFARLYMDLAAELRERELAATREASADDEPGLF